MSVCSFSIPVYGNSDELIGKAESAITGNNGTFSGTATEGSFEISVFIGSIKGNYRINGNLMDIIITDKPFMISCSRIEEELRKYLQSTPNLT